MAIQYRHGKSAFFSVSDASGSTFALSSAMDDLGLDRSLDTAQVTNFGDNDHNYLAGLRGATFNFSGHFNSTQATRLDGMLGHSTAATCVYGPGGNTTGYHAYEFSANLTGLSVGSPVGDKVSMSGTFQISGAVTSTSF